MKELTALFALALYVLVGGALADVITGSPSLGLAIAGAQVLVYLLIMGSTRGPRS